MFTFTHSAIAEARCRYIFIYVAQLTGTSIGRLARIRTREHLTAPVVLTRHFHTAPVLAFLGCLVRQMGDFPVGYIVKSGQSANKIRKFADFKKMYYICGSSANVILCGFAFCGPNLFCDLHT